MTWAFQPLDGAARLLSGDTAVTGVAAVSSCGAVVCEFPVQQPPVTSVAATLALGSVSTSVLQAVSVSGVAASIAVDTAVGSVSCSSSVTGVVATRSGGSVTAQCGGSASVAGVSVASSLGTLSSTVSPVVPVSGVGCTIATGTVFAQYGSVTSVAGVSTSASVGTANVILLTPAIVSGVLATANTQSLPYAGLALQTQAIRPGVDTVAGQWQPTNGGSLYAMVDEAVVDDGDYIYSSNAPSNDTCKLKLIAPPATPAHRVLHEIHYRVGSEVNGGTVKVTLLCGAVEIASWQHNSLDAFTTYVQSLSDSQATAITDYADLYLELVAS